LPLIPDDIAVGLEYRDASGRAVNEGQHKLDGGMDAMKNKVMFIFLSNTD
jgi:hypothetical protein